MGAIKSASGGLRWASPVADGAHWGEPVSVANGIAYTVDLKGFLDAYDAATGAPLLHRPIALGSATGHAARVTEGRCPSSSQDSSAV